MKLLLKRLFIPFNAIDNAFPKNGLIFDLGCGTGELAAYLSKIKSRKIIGIDQNQTRIQKNHTLHKNKKNLKFINTSVFQKEVLTQMSGCVMSDFLHHLSKADQKRLLKLVSTKVQKRGVVIIKEIDKHDKLRAMFSRLWDFLLYPNDKINYLSKTTLTSMMNRLGFKVNHIKTNKLVPASINLYVCTKQ